MLSHCAAVLSRLPLRVHYWIADYFLFPVIYYVARYRRKIVEKNLRCSFPDKDDKTRREIAKDFYHQFCYTIVESIYGYKMPDDEMRQHVAFEGMEEVNQLIEDAGGGIFMLAHLGNWEWMASIQELVPQGAAKMFVYRRLKSRAMDKLMLDIRAARGGVCVEKKRILREMVRCRAEKKIVTVGLLSDQKPRPEVTRTWTTFLHQETGFLDGGEVLGKKFGYPVFYLYITRGQRGCYRVQVKTLAATPRDTKEGEITLAYAHALEENIKAQPALWLWTHNRWKWKRVLSY